MKTWLSKTVDGKYAIKRNPCPNPGQPVELARPRAGVLHTTETYGSAIPTVFKQHYAPHFEVGKSSITQLVPLGTMAAALENAQGGPETNRWAIVQIEVVGHSQDRAYMFDEKTTDALASLLATLADEVLIPLYRPYPDSLPPKPWATEAFVRRHDGKWGKTAGWFGHLEIPENSHWDPGCLDWSRLLTLAKQRMPRGEVQAGMRHPPSPMPAWWWEWADWRRRGRPGQRPKDIPKVIPAWAWASLRAYNKKHPPD